MSSPVARPGAAFGIYPERDTAHPDWLEKTTARILRVVRLAWQPWEDKILPAVAEIKYHSRHCEAASGLGIEEITDELKQRLARDGLVDRLAAASFALVREVTRRELGEHHNDSLLACGWALHKGLLAEVEPGEDKTLAALLPACTAAFAGIPVHIMTGDDYLAERDVYRMRPVFVALGLSVGRVSREMPLQHRRAAYRCDVTYGSARQFACDYLQDRLLMQQRSGKLQLQVERLNRERPLAEKLRLPGLCYAIVDQAATTMVEQALTPLLLTAAENPAGDDTEVLGRIMLPQFFSRYLKLCGMSGTLQNLSAELFDMYGLEIYRVPPHQPGRQRFLREQVFADRASKLDAILQRVGERHERGQPVLVGVRSSAEAELLGQLLKDAGLAHQVLDPDQPSQSASKMAGAGAPGSITLATDKDGLGTDVALGDQARELGGLHLILSEHFDAAYIDRQFSQRCARRGEPGSVIAMTSLEDELATRHLPRALRQLIIRTGMRGGRAAMRLAQWRQETQAASARGTLLKANQQLDELLAFGGRGH